MNIEQIPWKSIKTMYSSDECVKTVPVTSKPIDCMERFKKSTRSSGNHKKCLISNRLRRYGGQIVPIQRRIGLDLSFLCSEILYCSQMEGKKRISFLLLTLSVFTNSALYLEMFSYYDRSAPDTQF